MTLHLAYVRRRLSATAHVLSVIVFSLLLSGRLSAQETGLLAGRLSSNDGGGIGGVTVEISELTITTITDDEGRFRFPPLKAGSYTVVFRAGDRTISEPGVAITGGSTTTLDKHVDWDRSFAETIVVNGVSRRQERIVDAPAAATKISGADVEREAAHGVVPRALAFTPGVELTQSSLNDFNVNTRGFNTVFNRRILTLVDGRDPSIPGLQGAQEWGATTASLDDVESVELVRGPGAALYGAGAFNGVLLVTTKAPRDSLGGRARITFGELGTQRYEGRHAAALGHDWYFKVSGGYQRSGDFTRSRVSSVEYAPGVLPLEAIAPPLDHYESWFGTVRFDKYFGGARALTVETGTAQFEGTTNVSDLGRVQQTDVARPWVRVNMNAPRWNVLASTSWRSAPEEAVLSSGTNIFLDSYNSSIEVQGNTTVAHGRGRVVGGAFVGVESADSSNRIGQQTIYPAVEDETRTAVYGQLDFDLTPALKSVTSLRWDESTLHDPQWSPRLALVYTIRPGHTARFSYNHAFKSPTLSERFVHVPVAPPVDLSAIEGALAPVLNGVPLGFARVPILGVGNESLVVETVTSAEVGYNAVIGSRAFVTASYYYNRLSNFTTSLLPQQGTSFGRLNPNIGPYQPPSQLAPAAAATVIATLQTAIPSLYPIMSNDADGSPIFVAISNRNYGRVNTQGVELGLYYAFRPGWMWTVSYDRFSFDVVEDAPESPLVPNAPPNQFATTLTYAKTKNDASIRFRWVDDFLWAAGIFNGPVDAYGVLDLSASRKLTDEWTLGVDVANALDNDHYEVFGGDLLGRRTLVSLTYRW